MSNPAREVIRGWGLDEEQYEKTDALIATLDAAGFVIVPKEPTYEMVMRSLDVPWKNGKSSYAEAYRVMIAEASSNEKKER